MKKRGKIGLILLLSIILFFILFMFLVDKKYDNYIYKEVYVEGINLSKLDKSEAKVSIYKNFEKNIYNKNLTILINDEEYNLSYEDLGVQFDVEKAINEAFNYGKDLNFVESFLLILFPKRLDIELDVTYNEKAVEGAIYQLESRFNIKPKNGEIFIDDSGKIQIEKEKNGLRLDGEKLKEDIIKNIDSTLQDEVIILKGNLVSWFPKITKKDLEKINSNTSNFSTNYSNSSDPRKNNIKIATKAIDGTVLMPGEEFSFNKIVGPRTVEKGYEKAHVILGNNFTDDFGGGICQVSSTLYNAVLKLDLKISERTHHSIPISYIPLGRDATVNYGSSDLKFINNKKYPIYIKAIANNDNVEFKIYSNNELNKISIEIESKVEKVIKPKDEIKFSSGLKKGERKLEKSGKNGYLVNVYKVISEEGKEKKRVLLYQDQYKPINNIVIEGK